VIRVTSPRRRFLTSAVAVVLLLAGLSPVGARLQGLWSGRDSGASPGRVIEARFYSQTLGQTEPYTVYLPPGYGAGSQRYPVLYMLHGLSGTHEEWKWYGIFETADSMIDAGQIDPFIIVLPQGDYGYWMDQAYGGPRWGTYLARDVVSEIDGRYRTLADPAHRAVGGLSMGADGALQLALNFPDVFGVAGAHSPVLRPYEIAPAFYGLEDNFDRYYPVALLESDPEVAAGLRISIDAGVADEWFPNAEAFNNELNALGIPHDWHAWPGQHDAAYWAAHVPDDLTFYSTAFSR
jgi:enterochelin esterase-like enzyme